VTSDEEAGGKAFVPLTLEQAAARVLANSPELRIVGEDVSISREDITQAASEFDPLAFSRLGYERNNVPANTTLGGGRSESRALELGIQQKLFTGTQWSLSYALTRNWDDLTTNTLSTRYEPALSVEIKQPLLREAGKWRNLAEVNMASLYYDIAMLGLRQRAESALAEAISAYWRLLQARRNREIRQQLLSETSATLQKVQNRRDIDATDAQIKQVEASVKAREAALLQDEKQIADVQDALVRLLADDQVSLLSELEVLPVSLPDTAEPALDASDLLRRAMRGNPGVLQAMLQAEVADINVRVAENEKLPKLDLTASAGMRGLARGAGGSNEELRHGEHISYGVGFLLEYPLGNRLRQSQLRQRQHERRRAISVFQNTSDQVAIQVKESLRTVETAWKELQVQKEAVQAARMHLEALEGTEPIRGPLTPEYLLVSLQAQEILATAERGEIRAVADLNIAVVRLAQATGTVLEMPEVEAALAAVLSGHGMQDDSQASPPQ